MKIGYGILTAIVALIVVYFGLYLRAKAEVQPVYDVLSIDERILQLRDQKFAKCAEITRLDLDKLDAIVNTCGEHLQLQ